MTTTAIVPAKNGMPWVITALESLAAQTRPLDHIFLSLDADTTDRTAIEVRQRWPNVIIVYGGYIGQARVFNAAAVAVRDEWILWQDADDWARPDRHELLMAHAEAHPDLGVIGSCVDFVWSASQPADNAYTREMRAVCDPVQSPEELKEKIPTRLGGYLLPATTLLRRSVFAAAGGLDPAFTYPGYDLLLRLLPATRLAKLPDRLYTYRLHAAQQTANRSARDADFERARRNHLARS